MHTDPPGVFNHMNSLPPQHLKPSHLSCSQPTHTLPGIFSSKTTATSNSTQLGSLGPSPCHLPTPAQLMKTSIQRSLKPPDRPNSLNSSASSSSSASFYSNKDHSLPLETSLKVRNPTQKLHANPEFSISISIIFLQLQIFSLHHLPTPNSHLKSKRCSLLNTLALSSSASMQRFPQNSTRFCISVKALLCRG